jgi:hypothetical protein
MTMVFLMCSERSGSNLITKILNGHNKICGPSTKHIFNPVIRNLFRYEPLSEPKNWLDLLTDISDLMSVDFSIWNKTFGLEDLVNMAERGDIATLLRNIYLEEAEENKKVHVVIKENQVYEFLPFLLLNYPDVKYIYQYRDPRDMALSWKKHQGHYGGVVAAAKQWQKDQKNNLKNHFILNQVGKSISMSYESLIENPVQQMKVICSFMEIEYDPNIYSFYEDELTQRNASLHSAWINIDKKIMHDNKNKYLRELSEREVIAIEKICWFEMNHLGYKPVFTQDEVNRFSTNEIIKLEKEEEGGILYNRSNRINENIAAKKRFYQRISWDGE